MTSTGTAHASTPAWFSPLSMHWGFSCLPPWATPHMPVNHHPALAGLDGMPSRRHEAQTAQREGSHVSALRPCGPASFHAASACPGWALHSSQKLPAGGGEGKRVPAIPRHTAHGPRPFVNVLIPGGCRQARGSDWLAALKSARN